MQRKDFVATVLSWQKQHGRHDLPWQQPASPYRVLVSEIMLQQTQVVTVIPYFKRWLASFPTLQSLAQASEDEVMAHWQGLGYYSRARNLHKAAKYLGEEYNYEFPNDLKALETIPGVGPYTAGAIRSFAFNEYGPIVDGNVKRFFCRLFGIEGQPNSSQVTKQLWQKAAELTPTENNRSFAQGLLDIGATLCTPKQPKCGECPFSNYCVAFATDRQAELPTPKVKKKVPERDAHFIWRYENNAIQLEKRIESGIWAALWCFPEVSEPPPHAILAGEFKHIFSHFKMHGHIWQLQPAVAEVSQHEPKVTGQQRWVSQHQLSEFGLPAPIKKILPKLWPDTGYN
ncbi:A/G-specific adenine glycosylase [Aliidiomarina quisquiliarum]|uniref:A/G-specific adenine glycosylase n=1 Tax=Aliidiomarina quisquiliarum TaxID=2938947 RepID=UPI00208F6AE9|nr:A/G-specific adenine glycosylase [Aliidiomarina quisquiliarum]MCO4321924.1 A/G-specific adenine glycosylase [Aliidiomarina quisquiliarum]